MNLIRFAPRWKEELVAASKDGVLIFEMTMGKDHVYFPTPKVWQANVPGWAKERWQEYYDQCAEWCKNNNIPFTETEATFVYEEKR